MLLQLLWGGFDMDLEFVVDLDLGELDVKYRLLYGFFFDFLPVWLLILVRDSDWELERLLGGNLDCISREDRKVICDTDLGLLDHVLDLLLSLVFVDDDDDCIVIVVDDLCVEYVNLESLYFSLLLCLLEEVLILLL